VFDDETGQTQLFMNPAAARIGAFSQSQSQIQNHRRIVRASAR